MSPKKLILAVVLLGFVALNVYALVTPGFFALFDYMATMGPWGWVIFVDLVIALSLVIAWMWTDARRRGATSVPHIIVTLLVGSIGPLLYLLGRPTDER